MLRQCVACLVCRGHASVARWPDDSRRGNRCVVARGKVRIASDPWNDCEPMCASAPMSPRVRQIHNRYQTDDRHLTAHLSPLKKRGLYEHGMSRPHWQRYLLCVSTGIGVYLEAHFVGRRARQHVHIRNLRLDGGNRPRHVSCASPPSACGCAVALGPGDPPHGASRAAAFVGLTA